VAVQLLQASYFNDCLLILAGVMLARTPLIIVFAVAGKQLVCGIMQGAVKG
jgi:cellobiose transport system permease protein